MRQTRIVLCKESIEVWEKLGMDSSGRILAVVYTWRETRTRIIPARKATAKETGQYKGEFNE